MDLSILIVNWNTRELLQCCLQSIHDHWSAIDAEIIVVDNHSSDGSAGMVSELFPDVILINNGDNLGFVRANNQAASIAKGRYLLLLNSDTRVLDSGATKVLEYLDQHKDVGIVTGKVLNDDGSFQHPMRRKPRPIGALMRHSFRLVVGFRTYFHKRFRMEDVDSNQEQDVDWVVGCYVFLRHELLDNGKVFDEEVFMYYEDTLLCHRCWERNYRVTYLPLAPIVHYGGGSAKQVRAFTAWSSFKSSVVYFTKTSGKPTARIYSAAVRGIWAALATLFGVMASVFGSRFRKKADFFNELVSLARSDTGRQA